MNIIRRSVNISGQVLILFFKTTALVYIYKTQILIFSRTLNDIFASESSWYPVPCHHGIHDIRMYYCDIRVYYCDVRDLFRSTTMVLHAPMMHSQCSSATTWRFQNYFTKDMVCYTGFFPLLILKLFSKLVPTKMYHFPGKKSNSFAELACVRNKIILLKIVFMPKMTKFNDFSMSLFLWTKFHAFSWPGTANKGKSMVFQ